MDLNSLNLGDVQHLLVELARALSPIANPTSSAANKLFLTRRFVPPDDPPTGLYERHPVEVLVKLHEVQEEVQKWVKASEPEEQAQILTQESAQKIPEKGLKPQTKEASLELPRPQAWVRKDASISPLVREAKQLIHQVQGAIAKLSSSTSIQQASEVLLRDALRKLKPGLDRIIQAIAEVQQKPSEREEKVFEERRLPSLPVPMRQKVVMQKLRELRQEREPPEEVEKGRPVKKSAAQKTPEKNELSQPAPTAKKERRPQKPVQEILEAPEAPREILFEKQKPVQKSAHSEIKPVALPISPMIFETKKITVTRKKKKRKGFWFKDEEDTK